MTSETIPLPSGRPGLKARVLKGLVVFATLIAAAAVLRVNWVASRGKGLASETAAPSPVAPANVMSAPHAKDEHEEKALEMALTKKPGHTPVLLKLAKLESESGRYKEAEKHLREVLSREEGNVEARLELGKVLYQEGDIEGAIRETSEILKSHPSHADALYNLGAIYGNLGNSVRAREYWDRLIATDPQSESGKRAQQMIALLPKPSR